MSRLGKETGFACGKPAPLQARAGAAKVLTVDFLKCVQSKSTRMAVWCVCVCDAQALGLLFLVYISLLNKEIPLRS